MDKVTAISLILLMCSLPLSGMEVVSQWIHDMKTYVQTRGKGCVCVFYVCGTYMCVQVNTPMHEHSEAKQDFSVVPCCSLPGCLRWLAELKSGFN